MTDNASHELEAIRRYAQEVAGYEAETFYAVVGTYVGRKMTVGRDEAHNHVHLRGVIAEADKLCPRAADTIRRLLWRSAHNARQAELIATDAYHDTAPDPSEASE